MTKQTAATGVVHIFRGTPTDKHLKASKGATLHHAKDLAYVSDKIKMIPLLNKIASLPEPDRTELWDRLFLGKFDPTNSHHQQYIVRLS